MSHKAPVATSQSKECHTNGTLIFDDPFELYAGNYHGAYEEEYDLLIDLAGRSQSPFSGRNLPPALEQFVLRNDPPVLRIDWPDYSTPDMSERHWQELYDDIIASGVRRVYVSCQGGHGRTGTFLAIMCHYAGVLPAAKKEDPVLFIRRIYCNKAVESGSQLDYFEEITGRKTTAPYKDTVTSYGSGYYSGGSNWQANVYGGVKSPASLPPAGSSGTSKKDKKKSAPDDDAVGLDGRPLSWDKEWWDH